MVPNSAVLDQFKEVVPFFPVRNGCGPRCNFHGYHSLIHFDGQRETLLNAIFPPAI